MLHDCIAATRLSRMQPRSHEEKTRREMEAVIPKRVHSSAFSASSSASSSSSCLYFFDFL